MTNLKSGAEKTQISDVYENVEERQEEVNGARRNHEIPSRSYRPLPLSAQGKRVTGTVIEAVEKVVEAVFRHVGGGSVVEP